MPLLSSDDVATARFVTTARLWLAAVCGTTRHFPTSRLGNLSDVNDVVCKLLQTTNYVGFENGPCVVAERGTSLVVDKDLRCQLDSLRELLLKHILEARARGTSTHVYNRMATLQRTINWERVVLFHDHQETVAVLEMLVRIGTQTGTAEWPREKLKMLGAAHADTVAEYLRLAMALATQEDAIVVQAEELRRLLAAQMAQHSLDLDEQVRQARQAAEDAEQACGKMRRIHEAFRNRGAGRELAVARWELLLMEAAVLQAGVPAQVAGPDKENVPGRASSARYIGPKFK